MCVLCVLCVLCVCVCLCVYSVLCMCCVLCVRMCVLCMCMCDVINTPIKEIIFLHFIPHREKRLTNKIILFFFLKPLQISHSKSSCKKTKVAQRTRLTTNSTSVPSPACAAHAALSTTAAHSACVRRWGPGTSCLACAPSTARCRRSCSAARASPSPRPRRVCIISSSSRPIRHHCCLQSIGNCQQVTRQHNLHHHHHHHHHHHNNNNSWLKRRQHQQYHLHHHRRRRHCRSRKCCKSRYRTASWSLHCTHRYPLPSSLPAPASAASPRRAEGSAR